MTPEKLRQLLRKSEGPTLDFKQELKIYRDNGKIIPRERDELIKDILALANGNEQVVGADKFLVYGAADRQEPDGTRELYEVEGKLPDRTGLLQTINSACEPNIANVDCEPISLNDKRLFVITVPPTPHVHETKRMLKTPSSMYHEYTVFMRHHASVRPASMQECETLRAAKQHYFRQRKNINPIIFGILNNAGLFAALAWSQTENMTNLDMTGRIIVTLGVSGLGAFTGWALGMMAKEVMETMFQWRWYSLRKRILFIAAMIIVIAAFIISFLRSTP